MKKLSKIRMIEEPIELNDMELSQILGGLLDNCGTYVVCGDTGKNSCTSYNDGYCDDRSQAENKCGSYSF